VNVVDKEKLKPDRQFYVSSCLRGQCVYTTAKLSHVYTVHTSGYVASCNTIAVYMISLTANYNHA